MKDKTVFKLLTIILPFLILILYLLRNVFFSLISFIPPCPFYTTFHLYCPACGNTRSTLNLLEGDLASSLRYNLVPALLVVLALLTYLELAVYSFGKHMIRLLPRKLSFYLVLIGLLICYFILRNLFPYFTP